MRGGRQHRNGVNKGRRGRFAAASGDRVPSNGKGKSGSGGKGERGRSNVCYAFQRGKCERGSKCRFEHVFEAGSGARTGRRSGEDKGGSRMAGGDSSRRNLGVYENVDEAFRIREKQKLEDFRDGIIKDEQITFSNTLTNHERRYVHSLAGNLGLVSKSYGKGATRYLTVRRTKKHINPDTLIPDRVVFSSQEEAAMLQFQEKYPRADLFADSARLEPGGGLVKLRVRHAQRQTVSYSQNSSKHIPLDPCKTPLYQQRVGLPAWEFRNAVVESLSRVQVMIVAGETGCGKSTQIPQFILDSIPPGAKCNMVVTQPRRISAMGLAERVAIERGEEVGKHVGFTVRLESKRSSTTELLFCTTGVMLRMLSGDPMLNGITHVVIDEVHERDRNSDFLLIIMRRLLVQRPELKLVLMSATIQRNLFEEYFKDIGVETICIQGRTFPVTQFFLESVLAQTKFLGKVKVPDNEEEKNALLNIVETKNEYLEDANSSGRGSVDAPGVAQDLMKMEDCDAASNNVIDDEAAILSALLAEGDEQESTLNNATSDDAEALAVLLQEGENEDERPNHPSEDAHVSDSVQAALAAISEWKPGDQLSFESSCPDEIDEEEELAAAMLAIASGCDAYGEQNGDGLGRPLDLVLSEYLNSSDESAVDLSLLLVLLEYIVTSSSLDTKYTSTDGKECLGGILVFLPGWGDISTLIDMMSVHPDFADNSKYCILPLHGGIAPQEQRKVFKRVGQGVRKIVLATNIAETSITIDDIVVVVDSGKYKSKVYDPYTQMSSLQTVWVPQSSAKQRAGRAGRVRPGICFTLMSRARYKASEPFAKAELLRTPLEELCLQIKLLVREEPTSASPSKKLASTHLSIAEFLNLAPEPPSNMAVRNAILKLQQIGALDLNERLTRLGLQLARIPMEPALGRSLVLAVVFGCLDPVLTICCALGYRDPFTIPLDNKAKKAYDQARSSLSMGSNSDHIAVLNAINGFLQLRNPSKEYGYCRRNFLSHSTMRMIKGMRGQVLEELVRLNLVADPNRSNTNSHAASTWSHANRNSRLLSTVTTVLSCGLYPNIMRRRPGMKNFDAPGQRKCRLNGSSVPNLPGGILSRIDEVKSGRKAEREAKHNGIVSRWITFGEMLKGMRSELVRDASVVSSRAILFGGGTAVAATANVEEENEGVEELNYDEENIDSKFGALDFVNEGTVSGPRFATLTIDANTEFHVKDSILQILKTLRGCVHAAVAFVVWKSEGKKEADIAPGWSECASDAINLIVDFVDSDYSRIIYGKSAHAKPIFSYSNYGKETQGQTKSETVKSKGGKKRGKKRGKKKDSSSNKQ